jgi:site-specific DNA-cytosine methylase
MFDSASYSIFEALLNALNYFLPKLNLDNDFLSAFDTSVSVVIDLFSGAGYFFLFCFK